MEELLPIAEGLLFLVGDEGITEELMAKSLEISEEAAQQLLDCLQKKYQDDSFGMEVVCYGGIWKFMSKAIVHPFAQKLFQSAKTSALSQSALETLAIVAYKQPITRVEIEEIRGVGCDMMLRKLQARNLITEVGRSEAPGRPILYGVTEEFMDSFKLLSLDELPDLPDFSEHQSDNLFD
jgi:segregation and condensation protein B